MLAHAWIFFLFAPGIAGATTRVKNPPPQSTLVCKARALFLGSRLVTESFEFRGQQQSARKVYWRLQLLDVNSPEGEVCPKEKEIEMRVRGASFHNGAVTYPVGMVEPKAQADISISLRKISGTDSRSKRPYSEWTLRKYE